MPQRVRDVWLGSSFGRAWRFCFHRVGRSSSSSSARMSEVVRIVTTLAVTVVSLYFSAAALRNLFTLLGQIAGLLLFLWFARFISAELGAGSLLHIEVFARAGESAMQELLWNNVDRLLAALQFLKTFQK